MRAALDSGKLDRVHYENYLKIRKEASALKGRMVIVERLKRKAGNKRPQT